jgi:hypothetical protein
VREDATAEDDLRAALLAAAEGEIEDEPPTRARGE